MQGAGTRGARQAGFTYIAVMLSVAISSAVLSAGAIVWHIEARRERERELLWVGDQYRRAIILHLLAGAAAGPRLPQSLDDLLLDRRAGVTRRYLRKPYVDPITRGAEWGLLKLPDGGIIGVYSLSEEAPIKRANFLSPYESFSAATRYSDWKFVLDPRMLKAAQPVGPRATPAPKIPAVR